MSGRRKFDRNVKSLGVPRDTLTKVIEAVPGSPAQSTTLCATRIDLEASVRNVYSLLKNNSDISMTDKAVIELQLISGARIGSVLQIKATDVSEIGQVRIPAEKGGLSVIVTPIMFAEFWKKVKKSGIQISQFRDRFYFYRLYKKHGICITIEGNQNQSVTHLLRHANIAATEGFHINVRERANYAGQKSTKSQESYLPGTRVKSKNEKGSVGRSKRKD